MSDAKKYLIQYLGACGNEALWWRPEGAGYTFNLDDAGRFTEDRAMRQESVRGMDKAWPEDAVVAISHRSVNVEKLSEMNKPRIIECGDTTRRNGWWYECSKCREELLQYGDEGDHLTCGKCGAEWQDGEFVEPAVCIKALEGEVK